MITAAFVRIKTCVIREIAGSADRHGTISCRACRELQRKIAETSADITRLETAALQPQAEDAVVQPPKEGLFAGEPATASSCGVVKVLRLGGAQQREELSTS